MHSRSRRMDAEADLRPNVEIQRMDFGAVEGLL